MIAEVFLDAVDQTCGTRSNFGNMSANARAVDLPHEGFGSNFLDTFDRPQRVSVCECERSAAATLGAGAAVGKLRRSREQDPTAGASEKSSSTRTAPPLRSWRRSTCQPTRVPARPDERTSADLLHRAGSGAKQAVQGPAVGDLELARVHVQPLSFRVAEFVRILPSTQSRGTLRVPWSPWIFTGWGRSQQAGPDHAGRGDFGEVATGEAFRNGTRLGLRWSTLTPSPSPGGRGARRLYSASSRVIPARPGRLAACQGPGAAADETRSLLSPISSDRVLSVLSVSTRFRSRNALR